MLLVDEHCGNGCSIKRSPLSVSYYNKIIGGHIGRAVVRTRCLPAQYCPCGYYCVFSVFVFFTIRVNKDVTYRQKRK